MDGGNIEQNPEIAAYYNELSKNELMRSDASLFPSYTRLTLPYRVKCRQRYNKAGLKQRQQFIKEISVQEALQSRALDGVRLHREFCNPVISPAAPSEILRLSPEEKRRLETILARTY